MNLRKILEHIAFIACVASTGIVAMCCKAHATETDPNSNVQVMPSDSIAPSSEYEEKSVTDYPSTETASELQCNENLSASKHNCDTARFQIEARVGCFVPTESVLRKIYGNPFTAQLEGLALLVNRLFIFANGDYISKDGRTVVDNYKTHIRIIGVSAGLKYFFKITNWLDLYFGAGPKYFFFKTHDYSPYVRTITTENGCGGVVKAGFAIKPCKYLLIDLFTDYSFKTFHPAHSENPFTIPYDVKVGGLSAGVGIGCRF